MDYSYHLNRYRGIRGTSAISKAYQDGPEERAFTLELFCAVLTVGDLSRKAMRKFPWFRHVPHGLFCWVYDGVLDWLDYGEVHCGKTCFHVTPLSEMDLHERADLAEKLHLMACDILDTWARSNEKK